MNQFEKIKQAIAARDKFLEEHPEYQELQDKIDKVLSDAGTNKHNRQVALQSLLLNTWYQIIDVWESPIKK